MIRLLIGTGLFIVLTILTQIGGVAYLLASWLARGVFRQTVAFIGVYALLSLGAVFIAPVFGREPLPCVERDGLAPRSILYCALNRQYVSPNLHQLATRLARHVDAQHPGSVTQYLDAGFPFADGFPLLPHLSHDDGRKVDFAFYYRAEDYLPGETPSPLGYWGFLEPHADDPEICRKKNRLTLRWDMGWFQRFVREDLTLDAARTGTMLRWLVDEGVKDGVEKVLLEPHLRARFALPPAIVRFQGCRAARHDDHVHVQVTGSP